VYAAPVELVLLAEAEPEAEAADAEADVEVELDVLLSQDATVGTVTPAVEQICWAKAIVLAWSAGLQFLLMQQERFEIQALFPQMQPMSY